ncbi:MAG TPA: PP2C family protein-serine/threonine phosphatase [Pilimelia sp.]|nr:PP2C family protein-serine/threonine phosphatase [Pilimelia sp.]
MYDDLTAARQILVDAPAYLLFERLAEHLAAAYGHNDTELFLVDYRIAALIPLRGGPPQTHPGSALWRSFNHQATVVDADALVVPVTVRGERLGVMRLSPPPRDDATAKTLADIGTLLAHELSAAWSKTDRYIAAARVRRLTLAAEMQWELLPGRSCVRPAFSLAGQLEPAYAVRGDSFDWADDANRLWLTVINGMGAEVTAATLTVLATNALRNARRAGLELADQAALADQALYAHYQGTQHAATLLLELDLTTGVVTVIDAGSPRLLLLRDGRMGEQSLDAQFPLGMFEGSIYRPQRFQLLTGDRLLVASDGVYEAGSSPTLYGESALARSVQRTTALAPLDAVRSVLGDMRSFVGGDLVDDAVLVCLDWSGLRPSPPDEFS